MLPPSTSPASSTTPASSGGGPVAGAGEIVVENGEPRLVSRNSGHYKPLEEHMQQVRDKLAEQGIDVSKVTFESRS